jgi:RimJ/RimL family protein N-acetyltransferase
MGATDDVATVEPLERLGLRVIAMTPTLAPALTRFHETLTAATTHSRFFAVHPHLSPAELIRFTTVDHQDREALVALDDDGEIVAVARFDRLSGSPSVAEVAFVVADAWQHHGVGTALFARLASQAAELGVEQFVAETMAGNRAMRAVFRHAGDAATEQLDDGIVRLTIELPLRCSGRLSPALFADVGVGSGDRVAGAEPVGDTGLEHLGVQPVDLGRDGGGAAGRDGEDESAALHLGHGGRVGVADRR